MTSRFDVTVEYPMRDVCTVIADDDLRAEDEAIKIILKKFPDLKMEAVEIIEVKELV